MMSLLLKKNVRSVVYGFRAISSSVQIRNVDGKPPEMIDVENEHIIQIPTYQPKKNEPIHLQKARLMYQSRKRGMLENGLLLSTFASKYLEQMNEQETALYDRLINLPTNDWDIFYWATGVKETPPEYDNEMMDKLKQHVANADKEERFHQPSLY